MSNDDNTPEVTPVMELISITPKKNDHPKIKHNSIDVTSPVAHFLTSMRLLYLEYMCEDDDDDLDIEVVRFSYQFERELRYVISDTDFRGETDKLLETFMNHIFHPDVSPLGTHWIDLLSDDNMQINALRVMNGVYHSLLTTPIEENDEEEQEETFPEA